MEPNTAKAFATSAVALGITAASFSTAAQQAGRSIMLEEMIVTTQKREQSLQDIPVSVTAFTADLIARAGISDFNLTFSI